MKRSIPVLVLALLMSFSMAFSDDGHDATILTLDQMTEQELEMFFLGGGDSTTLHVEEGLCMPMELFVSGEFLELVSNPESELLVTVKKSFFVKNDAGSFLFSSDLTEWHGFTEFCTGSAGAALKIEDGVPCIYLTADVNSRS